MRLNDLISLILDNLGRRKGRVAMTAIGVVIGTAAVITLVSLGFGLQKSATSNLWGINELSTIRVYPGMGEAAAVKSGGGGGGGGVSGNQQSQMKVLNNEAIANIHGIPGVKQVITQESLYGGMEMKYEQLIGYGQLTGLNIVDLTEIGQTAMEGLTTMGKGKVIIGSWVPRNFFPVNPKPNEVVEPPELMGKTLKVDLIKYSQDGLETRKSIRLEVIGVLKETKGESDFTMYVDQGELVQWNEWMNGKRTDRNKEGYQSLMVQVDDPKDATSVSQAINDLGFQAWTPQSMIQSINSFYSTMQVIFGGVGAIALLVAAIGIANTMAMAILERTREIGIMKAIGATNNNILSIFLGEAGGIGLIGGIGGVLVSWGVGGVINTFASSYLATQNSGGGMGGIGGSIAVVTPWWLPFFSLIFATIVGLISGLYPALSAATMVPVDALKYE